MDEQEQVARFMDEYELHAPPTYRVLDLVSEVGEVSKEINTSTSYGHQPNQIVVSEDEIGDLIFALLALCDSLEIDASTALTTAMAKYERRINDAGDPGSGE